MAAKPLSKSQLRALRWLADRGGHATLDQHGRAIAREERCGFLPATWLRLVILGYVARSILPGHFGITAEGIAALGERA